LFLLHEHQFHCYSLVDQPTLRANTYCTQPTCYRVLFFPSCFIIWSHLLEISGRG